MVRVRSDGGHRLGGELSAEKASADAEADWTEVRGPLPEREC